MQMHRRMTLLFIFGSEIAVKWLYVTSILVLSIYV